MENKYLDRTQLIDYLKTGNQYIMASTSMFDNKLSIFNEERKGIIILTDSDNLDLVLSNNRKKSIVPCKCKSKTTETYQVTSGNMITTLCKGCNVVIMYEKIATTKSSTNASSSSATKNAPIKGNKEKIKKEKAIKESIIKDELTNKKDNRPGLEIDTIYNENNIHTCDRIGPETTHLVLTSPPYDGLKAYDGYVFDFPNLAKGLTKILVPGGIIVWVVGDEFTNGSESLTSFKQALYFKEVCGLNVLDTMIYKKFSPAYPSKVGRDKKYSPIFEYMFIFCKGTPRVANLIVNENPLSSVRLRGNKYEPMNGVRYNIWEYENGAGKTTKDKFIKHPAMFPEQLALDHILSWSNEGDIIYDPFMGAGTTAKMAILTKRHYIGSEISDKNNDKINKRIANVTNPQLEFHETKEKEEIKQLNLF